MNQNDGKEEAEMSKDGGNATAMMTTVMATTSPLSRECKKEERGGARTRMEDKPK
jgi:hypothetical protein